jgi:hypothetical protein
MFLFTRGRNLVYVIIRMIQNTIKNSGAAKMCIHICERDFLELFQGKKILV